MAVNQVVIEGFANFVKTGVWEGRNGGEDTMWCNFSLAHSAYAGKDDNGKPKYNDNYFNVKVKGRLAELAGDFLDGKGRRVLVTGYLQQRSYDKDGENRSVIDIIATDLRRLDSLQSFGSDGESRVPAGVGAGVDSDEEPF